MNPLLELHASRRHTEAAFCFEHGITPAQFAYWRRRLRQETSAAESGGCVEGVPPVDKSQTVVELAYLDGMPMRFSATPSASCLAEMVGS